MKEQKHLTEAEIIGLLSQKNRRHVVLDDHLSQCVSCQNEASSLNKTIQALNTVKQSRQERIRLLTQSVTNDLSRRKSSRRNISAVAAVVVFLTFGLYLYMSFFAVLADTDSNSLITAIPFGNINENAKVHIRAKSVGMLGEHSSNEATSRSIVASVVHKGEVRNNGRSQQDSLSVASNHIIISSSTSF